MVKAHRIGLCVLLVASILAGGTVALAADNPRIVLDIPDTSASAGESGAWLNIYFSNISDTIAALDFRISADRPDLVWFDLAGADFDTAGTLLSGFELVLARDSAGQSVYRLIAMANLPFSGPETPGFPPQSGGVLVRLPFSTAEQPDTAGGLTCNLEVIGPLVFSDPWGNTIGMVVVDTVSDTLYYRCTGWSGEVCQGWVLVDPDTTSWDSIYVYDRYVQALDTTQVVIVPGSITVLSPVLLTCDMNADGAYSISDLTCLTDYLFRGGSCGAVWCDCDASGNDPSQPNIGDLTCMVAFLFRGGEPPGE